MAQDVALTGIVALALDLIMEVIRWVKKKRKEVV